jgi:hypothetical protein
MPPDVTALRLCLDRIGPPQKDRRSSLSCRLRPALLICLKVRAINQGVAAGDITTREASELSKLVETHRKALEIAEIETRLTKLESQAELKGQGASSISVRPAMARKDASGHRLTGQRDQ